MNISLFSSDNHKDSTYFKLSELLLFDELLKGASDQFYTEETSLIYYFHFGNPPRISFHRVASNTLYPGHFEWISRRVNERLLSIDNSTRYQNTSPIDSKLIAFLKENDDVEKILLSPRTVERKMALIEPYIVFFIKQRISHGYRTSVYESLIV